MKHKRLQLPEAIDDLLEDLSVFTAEVIDCCVGGHFVSPEEIRAMLEDPVGPTSVPTCDYNIWREDLGVVGCQRPPVAVDPWHDAHSAMRRGLMTLQESITATPLGSDPNPLIVSARAASTDDTVRRTIDAAFAMVQDIRAVVQGYWN